MWFHLILSDVETRTEDEQHSSQNISEEAELRGERLERPRVDASQAPDWRTAWEGDGGAVGSTLRRWTRVTLPTRKRRR